MHLRRLQTCRLTGWCPLCTQDAGGIRYVHAGLALIALMVSTAQVALLRLP